MRFDWDDESRDDLKPADRLHSRVRGARVDGPLPVAITEPRGDQDIYRTSYDTVILVLAAGQS